MSEARYVIEVYNGRSWHVVGYATDKTQAIEMWQAESAHSHARYRKL